MSRNLKFFILRAETKNLYRRFMKLTRMVEDRQQRVDLRNWIRDDFKMNMHLTDELEIKSQHIRARAALDELETSIDLSRAKHD